MEKNYNYCRSCKFFTMYYTKSVKEFKPLQKGQCKHKNEFVDADSGCENFERRISNFSHRKFLSLRISELLREISAIRMVIEDDKNENL